MGYERNCMQNIQKNAVQTHIMFMTEDMLTQYLLVLICADNFEPTVKQLLFPNNKQIPTLKKPLAEIYSTPLYKNGGGKPSF
jgi:hypothetical protein